ncbi:MAG: type I 3-dehydroquinate dehydratase [Candidatus Methanoperedens sp.]|nr:type I 3-dehydroquinate dehydratase [Candidatus Methanoperedens sp.]
MTKIGTITLNRSIVAAIGDKPTDTAIMAKKFGADILELRTDLLGSDAHQALQEIKKTGLPVIITNRMKQEGGSWKGSEDERIRTLISLLPAADAVDIELCAKDRDEVVKKAREAGKTVIISTHDFQKTPGNDIMNRIINDSFAAGADIAKLAVMPNSLSDVLRLLDVTLHSKAAVCTIAMGETGKYSRVVAPIYGSVLTYGYVEKATAPGQLRVDELRQILKLL